MTIYSPQRGVIFRTPFLLLLLGVFSFHQIINNWQRFSKCIPLDTTLLEPQNIHDSVFSVDVQQPHDSNDFRYNFTVAICAVVKDAEAYFEEWIDYHLMAMKFSNIYIVDNSKQFELQRWFQNTRSHPIYQRVTIKHDPSPLQNEIMNSCIREKKDQHDYIAVIDVDEFFVPSSSYRDIRDVLKAYLVPFGGALCVNWILMGSSNRSVYAPQPVTKRFQYREAAPSGNIKSIVRTHDFVSMRNPHAFELRNGTFVHNTVYAGSKQNLHTASGASDNAKPMNVLLLYHYRYTSRKEYLFKRCYRGTLGSEWCTKDGKSLKKDTPYHIQIRPGAVFDDTAWRILTNNVPKYKMYDQFEDYN